MAALTLTHIFNTLTSSRVKQAIGRGQFFGACSSLRNACANLEQMSRTIRNIEERFPERAAALRTSAKFAELDKKVDDAANKAAGIHAICEAHDIMLTVDFAPPLPSATTMEEAQRIADVTGLSVDTILEKRQAVAQKKYGAECEVEDFAAAAFWSAEAPVSDALVKYESVQKAIEKTQLYLIEWSTPDYQELALIKMDEEISMNWDVEFPDERLPEGYMDEDEVAARHRAAELKALDAHAKQQAAVAHINAERAEIKAKASRKRVPKVKAETA